MTSRSLSRGAGFRNWASKLASRRRAPSLRIAPVAGEGDELDLGAQGLAQPGRHFEAVHLREAEVEEDDLGVELVDDRQGRDAVGRHAADAEMRLARAYFRKSKRTSN